MGLWVSIVGLVIATIAIFVMLQPARLVNILTPMEQAKWLYMAALVRFLIGSLLIAAAPVVAYSYSIALVGWLFVLAALVLVVIPHPVMLPLIRWAARRPQWLVRLMAPLALAFGCFLIYAANV